MIASMILNDDRSETVRYNTPEYPVYTRRSLLSRYPDRRAPNHWHDDVEFACILSGQMRYSVNGETLVLRQGDGVFVNSGQMHFGFPDGETDWSQDVSTAPLHALSSFSRIRAILCEHAPKDDGMPVRQSQDISIVKNMVGFIQKNYRSKISLAEIAASGAVGQSKCCKLFTRYFFQSPNEYLNHYRIDKSLDLLRNTDLSVTETALSAGFSNASYYAEVFRRHLGESPREFRNSFRDSC